VRHFRPALRLARSEPIALLSRSLTTRSLAQLRSMATSQPEPAVLLRAFLRVMLDEIVPKTRANVASGSKVFGASVHRKADLSVVTVGTNTETESPLLVRPAQCRLLRGKGRARRAGESSRRARRRRRVRIARENQAVICAGIAAASQKQKARADRPRLPPPRPPLVRPRLLPPHTRVLARRSCPPSAL